MGVSDRAYDFYGVEAGFQGAFGGMNVIFDCGFYIIQCHFFGCFGWDSAFGCEAVIKSDVSCGGT